MPSTSTLQPAAARRAQSSRYRVTAPLRAAHGRSARAGMALGRAALGRAALGRTAMGRTVPGRTALARSAEHRQAHAGPAGLARRRVQLEARWRDRLEQVTALSLAYHEEAASAAPGPAGPGAGSRRARQLARQVVAERQALAEVEAALDRLAAGQYGWCEQCGRPVTLAILAAQPEARYCAACARVPAQARLSARHPRHGQRIVLA